MEPIISSEILTLISSLACGLWAAFLFSLGWAVYKMRKFYKNRIASSKIRRQLAQANGYRDQLQQLLKTSRKTASMVRLENLIGQIEAWTTNIESLARRVDNFQQDKFIRRDLVRLPGTINNLKRQIAAERNPDVQVRLEQTLKNKETHLASLKQLQATMHQAEVEIEHTVSSMGIIYTQVVTGQSTTHVANYSRLSAEVDDQVDALSDYLEALEEVHMERATRLGQ